MPNLRSSALVLLPALAIGLPAQIPYGAASPGTGGIAPKLAAYGAPWLGSQGFGLTITGGRGGAPAVLAISGAAGDVQVGATRVLVDLLPGELLLLQPLILGGSVGLGGAGSASVPLPLPGPATPALSGFELFMQAAVLDPVVAAPGFAATAGLFVEAALPPQIFVGTSVAGSADPTWIVDSNTLTVTHQLTAGTDNVTGAAFAEGNRYVYVATNNGDAIAVFDTTTQAAYQTFWSDPGGALGIGIDRRNDVVWTNGTSGGGRELVALDAAIGSPTYGTVLAATTGLSLQMTSSTWKWRLSPSGRIAAVVDGILPAPRLWIVDTDPTSASFLSYSDAGLIPVAPGSFYVSADDCVITPGDEQVVVTLEHGLSSVTEIARYDVAAGAWIDHDPSTPAIDAIGPNSLPAVTPLSIFTDIDVSPDGGVVAFAGLGAGVARLLIDPRSGAFWDYAFFAASGSESNTWACAVSPDGAQVAFTSWAGGATSPGPAKVTILDTFTGAVVGSAALGTATNIYTCVWR